MSKNTNILRYLDWPMVLMYLMLVLFGWLNVYGASHDIDQTSIFDFAYFSGKQLLWIATAVGLAGIVLLIDARAFQSFSMLLYAGMLLLLLIRLLQRLSLRTLLLLSRAHVQRVFIIRITQQEKFPV